MPWHPPVPGVLSAAYEFAMLVEELTVYGTRVGLSRSQAQEVIRVTWEHCQHRGFAFDLCAGEIRNNMVKRSFGERWRP
jgi:hypothetical protein